jgi:hypothetical protein
MATNIRGGKRYMAAIAALKGRGQIQECWRCGKTLYADVPKNHPNSITLGHYTALEDGGDLLDPHNHGPECMHCNYSDGARRSNRNQRARKLGITSTPSRSWSNPAW